MIATNTSTDGRKPLSWQGWTLSVPLDWNPLKLEGDFDRGSMLIGDLNGPKLAMRWATPLEKHFDADEWSRRAMSDEGDEGTEGTEGTPRELAGWSAVREFSDPKNENRTVWVGYSSTSGRVLQISGVAIDPPQDAAQDAALEWSIFDLSCRTPSACRLSSHRLNAGDLTLAFSRGREQLSIRQIAMAQLALKRMPLARWLHRQAARHRRHYRLIGEPIASPDGGSLRLARRRRFWWSRNLRPELMLLAVHDQARDRLILFEASDSALIQQLSRSIASSVPAPASAGDGSCLRGKPLRHATATFEPRDPGGLLRIPLKPRWPFRFPVDASRTFELDELGRLVWELCDGQHTLAQIITALAERYGLNLREAEVATTAFLRTLASRGLVTVDRERA